MTRVLLAQACAALGDAAAVLELESARGILGRLGAAPISRDREAVVGEAHGLSQRELDTYDWSGGKAPRSRPSS